MDFYNRVIPTSEDLIYREEGYYVWCGNLFKFGGVAYADHPKEDWTWVSEPIIDVSEKGIDSLLVSNPTALVKEDNRVLMLYKAVAPEEGRAELGAGPGASSGDGK